MGANDYIAPAGKLIQCFNKMDSKSQSRIQTKLLDNGHAVTDSEIEWLKTTVTNSM